MMGAQPEGVVITAMTLTISISCPSGPPDEAGPVFYAAGFQYLST